MKKKLKRTLAAISAAAMLFTTAAVLPENAFNHFGGITASAEQSGSGWSLDDAGTLTITTNDGTKDWKNSGVDETLIKNIVIQAGVTSINNTAFCWCSSLKSITIPEGVTSIGDGAFGNCSSLTSITIPDSVTSIGTEAFYNCSNLTSITIPNSVTSIGNSAFFKCSSLTSITIPEGVTSIGNAAFCWCSNLASINIPENVTSIGDGAFEYCSSLTSITIPDNVTSIGEWAFGCSSLTSMTIPDNVTSIGDFVFYDCSSLTSITIPDSVTSIGDSTFNGCKSLTSITIPDSVTSIGNYAFNKCSSLTSITIPDSVTSIGKSVFEQCLNLTSITIPNSVTSIGDSAFSQCSKLDDIIYPSGLDVSNASIPNSTTKVEYTVDGDGIRIDNVTLGSGKTNVEISNTINGKNVTEVAERFRNSVSDSGHTHKGGTATCQKKAKCAICGTEYGDLGEHTIVNIPASDATCVKTGNIEYWACSDCGACFSDSEGKTEITLDSTVVAKGSHTLTRVASRTATCTSAGYRQYWYCSGCGKYFSDSAGTVETTWSAIRIPARGHYYVDGKCYWCGRFEDGIGRLSGASLSLSGNIGVNFFMELNSGTVNDENAYMQFTLPNGDTPKILVSDAQQKDGYYVFSCEVSAKEMDSKITAQMVTSYGDGTVYEYSVREYADSVSENQSGFDDKTIALVNAMANYGDFAKAYFGGGSLTATEEMNAVTADIFAGYEKREQGELPKGITYYGSSLILESNTTLRHYFKVAEGTDVSTLNFSGSKGNYYYLDIANIAAGDLFDTNTTTVGNYTIEYSPMTYVLAVLNNDSADETLKNTVKALYLYAKAANSYTI